MFPQLIQLHVIKRKHHQIKTILRKIKSDEPEKKKMKIII